VGFKHEGPVKQLSAGAHIYSPGAEEKPTDDQGYITSVGFSPTLGHFVGLGFVKDGLGRHGEVLRMVDHMRGLDAQVELCDPVFFDPEGGRARG
jgi:sarcosine oxidase subunit alpha